MLRNKNINHTNNIEKSILSESALLLLQEFWGYTKTDSKLLIEKTHAQLTELLSDYKSVDDASAFINKFQSHIRQHLFPASSNVSVLNQGEINALKYAGKQFWNYFNNLTQRSEVIPPKSDAGYFITACFLAQKTPTNAGFDSSSSQSTSEISSPTVPEMTNKATISSHESESSIQFSLIFKWMLFGFIIVFILAFLLLKLLR